MKIKLVDDGIELHCHNFCFGFYLFDWSCEIHDWPAIAISFGPFYFRWGSLW